mmetsp:Transcript_10811/g.35494  ORF Transcript_10811/g.35494 Transcript_10811/m.35494 type:complete len:357 (-) Transcript_10811:963-2033(-)
MVVAVRLVVRADRHQPGVLARGARVGLERHGVKAGDFAELVREIVKHLRVPLRLRLGGVRVHVARLVPRHRNHLRGCVELHGARPERDHRVHEREVLRLEARQIANHLVLGVVRVEDWLCEERGGALEPGRDDAVRELAGERRRVRRRLAERLRKGAEQRLHLLERRRLVRGDAHGGVAHAADVDARLEGGRDELRARAGRAGDGDGVEARARGVEAELGGAGADDGGEAVGALRDSLEPLRAVVDGVHRRHVGEERLCRADVRGGFVAADVLLARLHRHAERGVAHRVDGDADDAPRHEALVLVRAGEEGGVRPAKAHRHAEALRRPDRDVRVELSRRLEHRQREQIGRHNHLHL